MNTDQQARRNRKKHAKRAFIVFCLLLIGIGLVSISIYQGPDLTAMFWNSWHHHADHNNGSGPSSSNASASTISTTTASTPTSTQPPILVLHTPSTTPAITTPKPTTTTTPIIPVTPSSATTTPNSTVLTAPSTTTSTVFHAPLNYNFGMSVGESMLGLNSATLNARLDDMASLGIGWLRFDIQWDHVQPNNASNYNWGYLDSFIAAANARHIKLLAILDYTPWWARTSSCESDIGNDRCPPADDGQYDAYAKAVVARYASQISAWEIWNEPNLSGSWQPSANASAYSTLLKSAYSAIKSQDPSAFVISGGMGPAANEDGDIAPVTFLSDLYADGAGKSFDAVGFHPYTYPAMPLNFYIWNAWSQMASTSPSLRSVMTANGDSNKKIWMTEYGAPTGGPGVLESSASDNRFNGSPDHVTETLQSQMIAQAITAAKTYSWAGPLLLYSYKDLGTSNSTVENFFGVIRYDGSTKPAYNTIKSLLAQ